ncbi:MAG: hypothetical protein PHC94_05585 [Methylobacter sp.]|nr:hypothetical protein [Methylobacter sp.]
MTAFNSTITTIVIESVNSPIKTDISPAMISTLIMGLQALSHEN